MSAAARAGPAAEPARRRGDGDAGAARAAARPAGCRDRGARACRTTKACCAGIESFDAFIPLRGRAWRDVVGARTRAARPRLRCGGGAARLARAPRSTRSSRASRSGSATRATRCAAPARATRSIRRASAGGASPISMIERYLRLARALGVRDAGDALELHVHAEAAERAEALLARAGVARGERAAARHAGRGVRREQALAARALRARLRRDPATASALLPRGGAGAERRRDRDRAARLRRRSRGRHVALLEPDPSLEVFAAIVARAALVLTNDTGPRHVAVALGRPVVTLIGPTDPRHTAHLLERQRVLFEDVACRPCGQQRVPDRRPALPGAPRARARRRGGRRAALFVGRVNPPPRPSRATRLADYRLRPDPPYKTCAAARRARPVRRIRCRLTPSHTVARYCAGSSGGSFCDELAKSSVAWVK